MRRYIDADALKSRMFNYYECVNENTSKSGYKGETLMNYEVADMIEDCIDNAPTADVVEVRHSRIKWINRPISAQYATVTDENGERHYGKVCDQIENNPVGYCGECGKRLDDTFMNYCPNCGAKMDGERRSENEG